MCIHELCLWHHRSYELNIVDILAGCTGEDEQDMAAVEFLKRKVCYFPRLGRGNWGVEPTAGGGSSRAATRNRITATAPAKKTMSRPILLVNGHVK